MSTLEYLKELAKESPAQQLAFVKSTNPSACETEDEAVALVKKEIEKQSGEEE